jgi:hypothetical protein
MSLVGDRKTPPSGTKTSRSENALARVVKKLGADGVKEFQKAWANVRLATAHSKDWYAGEEIIIRLLKLKLSQIEIRELLRVGGSRVGRIKQSMKDPDSAEVSLHSESDDVIDDESDNEEEMTHLGKHHLAPAAPAKKISKPRKTAAVNPIQISVVSAAAKRVTSDVVESVDLSCPVV